ncbi:MAG: sensor histidine kinase [Candidatus Nanopelagicales bacterium]
MRTPRTLAQIAAARTDLTAEQVARCERLVKDLGLVADLAFADLVLWLPVWNRSGYVAVAQVRPTTAATSLPADVQGRFVPRGRHPEIDQSVAAPWRGLVVPRVDPELPAGEEAVGVAQFRGGPAIAVLTRSTGAQLRSPGALERTYLRSADDLLEMIRSGEFPFASQDEEVLADTRVGDGLLRLDPAGGIAFASPNAASAFRRLGLATELVGARLALVTGRIAQKEGGVDASLAMVAGGQVPGEAAIDTENGNVTLRSLPLLRGGRNIGALVLVRDVTDLRSRELALISKDATIREVHHRVKNNLQTVAALLRMQARRLPEPQAAAALAEAERRVAAIAVVHDLLAQPSSEQAAELVSFDLVADRLVALVGQTASVEGLPVRRVGRFGQLPGAMATSMAMALVELLANAIEHGAPAVELRATREGQRLTVVVSDAGAGFPPDMDVHSPPRLGLRIVSTLITQELRGELSFERVAERTEVRAVVSV